MDVLHDFDVKVENMPGSEYSLTSQWVFWKHNATDLTEHCQKKFIPNSQFHTIAGFWNFIHHSLFLKEERFVLMRKGISPQWEDPHHSSGSHIIITIDHTKYANNIIIEMIIGLVGECLFNESYDSLDITGITYINSPKLKQIRFWSKNDKIPVDLIHLTGEYKSIFYKYRIKHLVFKTFAELKEKSENVIKCPKSSFLDHTKRRKLSVTWKE